MYFIHKGFFDNRYWIIAGIFTGLAYLTKGTALFLIPGFVFSSFVVYRLTVLKNRHFWFFFLMFLLVASPLLIRNVRVYGDPFFNVNNYIVSLGSEALNASRYQTFDLKEGAGLWKFETNESGRPSARSSTLYLEKVRHLVKAALVGSIRVGKVLTYDLWPGPHTRRLQLIQVLLLFLLVVGITREKDLGTKVYIVTTVGVFLASLAFFRPLARYVLPILPILWIYIALGILTVIDLLNQLVLAKPLRSVTMRFCSYALLLLVSGVAGYTYMAWPISNPARSVDYNESRLDILHWLQQNLGEDERYTLGPNFNWQLERGVWILPPRNAREDFTEFSTFVKDYNVSYVILEWKSLLGGVDNHQKLVENYFELNPLEGIVEKNSINGWTLVYKDKNKPVDFLIYRIAH
jgi:4-amino-4-deoxy-L-arabinose transferase-like glycosyltransferase